MKLLKNLVKLYVVIKVTPPIIKGVAYIAEGAATGIANKIVKDIFVIIDGDRERTRRNLQRGSRTYVSYYKDKA